MQYTLIVFTCQRQSFIIFIVHMEDTMLELEPWLSVEEISRYLAVSKETIYRWLDKEMIPAHRIGKLWRFKPSEVDDWVMYGGASLSIIPKKHYGEAERSK